MHHLGGHLGKHLAGVLRSWCLMLIKACLGASGILGLWRLTLLKTLALVIWDLVRSILDLGLRRFGTLAPNTFKNTAPNYLGCSEFNS